VILPCKGRWQRAALTEGYPPLDRTTPLRHALRARHLPLRGRIETLSYTPGILYPVAMASGYPIARESAQRLNRLNSSLRPPSRERLNRLNLSPAA
jgi:hypothetical protein